MFLTLKLILVSSYTPYMFEQMSRVNTYQPAKDLHRFLICCIGAASTLVYSVYVVQYINRPLKLRTRGFHVRTGAYTHAPAAIAGTLSTLSTVYSAIAYRNENASVNIAKDAAMIAIGSAFVLNDVRVVYEAFDRRNRATKEIWMQSLKAQSKQTSSSS